MNFVFDHVEIIAQYLKVAIDRRSSTVADYVESYLGAEERERFLEVVATKVRLMVEIREIQEKVRGSWKNLPKTRSKLGLFCNMLIADIFCKSGEAGRDAVGSGVTIGRDQFCKLVLTN